MASNASIGKVPVSGGAHTIYFKDAQAGVNIATDGVADIRYTTDGTTATVASTLIAAGAAREVAVTTVKQTQPCIVSVFAPVGGVQFSVCPAFTSLSQPAHPPGAALIDRY